MTVRRVKPDDRFGALVVLAQSGNSKAAYHAGIVWRCRCDCGREIDLGTTRLTRDNKRYCVEERHPEEHAAMKRAGMARSRRGLMKPRTISVPFKKGGFDDDFDDMNG